MAGPASAALSGGHGRLADLLPPPSCLGRSRRPWLCRTPAGRRLAIRCSHPVRPVFFACSPSLARNTMTPVLIGYFPKRTLKRPAWLPCPQDDEICSVSGCISEEPDGWIEHWRHNECWCFDSQELAWS